MDIELIMPNIETFYTECELLEDTGNKRHYDEHGKADRAQFIGIPVNKIEEYKFYYPTKDIQFINEDIFLSGSSITKKFSDTDGEEMNMDRFNENLPYLERNVRTHGNKQGKFVNVYVNVCEPWMVGADKMQYKAKTAIEICDLLESQGYKVSIYNRIEISRLGTYKGQVLNYVSSNILLKSSDQPLIKPLIYTTISPWFFRYWWFRFLSAKFNTAEGMGSPARMPKGVSDKSNIYINTGECLHEEGKQLKIEQIKKLFGLEEEDE